MSQQLPYSYVNLGDARQQLANRLYDSAQIFWSADEINRIIVEALRTWNALTSMWREDFTFQTVQGTTWYDLTDLSQMPNTVRPYTVTDEIIYQDIFFHLLEPVGGPVSVQFTTDDVVNAVQRRRDEVLSVTSCTQTRLTVPAVNGRITLDDHVFDVRRMAYIPGFTFMGGYGSGYYGQGLYGYSNPNKVIGYVVWPGDVWSSQSFNRLWTLQPPGKPRTYIMSTEPPLSFTTDRAPDSAGAYELLVTQAGNTLVFGSPIPLQIPDDWTHVVKWGALSDLFGREANASDPLRQEYCEQRYKMGMALLKKAPALLAMRNGDVAMQIDAVRSADLYNTNWQAQAQAKPKTALYSGLNLIALTPTPDGPTVPYMMTVTCVENAPVPVADGDQIQVSRGDYDAVLDYCVHLAMLKVGGAEFSATIPLFRRFLDQASTYGLKLREIAEYTDIIYSMGNLEKAMNPVMVPEDQS